VTQKQKNGRWHLLGLITMIITLIAILIVLPLMNSAQAAEKVTIGALRFTSSAPLFIAYEKGYFAEQGLEAEFQFFQGAQPVAVAIAAGDVDFGVTALSGGFFNLAGKGVLKVIAGHYHEEKGYDGSAIMASNQAYEAGLTTPEKLPGHSMAMTQVGSSFHYMSGKIAAKAGFDLADVDLKPLQKVPNMIAALKSAQVDAMIIVPHIARPLEKAGAAKIIGWIYDYAPYQVTTLFTSTKNIEQRRDVVEKFVKAYQQGIADYRAVMLDQDKDPAATEAITKLIHKYVYTDQPYEKAAASIKAGAIYVNENARLDLGDVYDQLAWFQQQGLVSKDITPESIVDTGFVEVYNTP
jgi:NitT/TauT family transport system substrate-binding protein